MFDKISENFDKIKRAMGFIIVTVIIFTVLILRHVRTSIDYDIDFIGTDSVDVEMTVSFLPYSIQLKKEKNIFDKVRIHKDSIEIFKTSAKKLAKDYRDKYEALSSELN